MTITEEKKHEIIAKHGKQEADTGSAAVQIAILTERIRKLSDHLQANRTDFASRRGLLMLIGKRRRLQSYYQRVNPEAYARLIKSLDLRR